MKRITYSGLGLLALAALLAAGPARADNTKGKPEPAKDKADPTRKADVYLSPVKVQPHASTYRVLKKKAVAHKPFEMEDPKTKKKYKPDDLIPLPGGKKMKAGEYFAELNKLEKQLNELGHSLRDGEPKTTLVQSVVNTAELEKKAAETAKKHLKFDAKTMRAVVKRDVQLRRHAELASKDQARVTALKKITDGKASFAGPAPKVAPKTTQWAWSKNLGNRKLIAVSLNAKLATTGSTDRVQVRGEAGADGYLHGHKQSLIKATGVLTVPKAGDSTVTVAVSVLGRTVYNKNLAKKTNFSHKDQKSTTIDKSVSFRFQLGPVPIKVTMGARGTVGFRYLVGVRPLHAEAQFIPFARVEAYAEAKADIGVAGAGFGGKLRLIDFELRIGGELTVKFDKSNRPQLVEHAYVQSELKMLSGSLYLTAYIGFGPFKKTFEWDFFKWKGVSVKGYLFNVHKTQNLF